MVKRLIVAIAILSLASFSFTPALVKAENGDSMSSAGEDERREQEAASDMKSAAEPNSKAESGTKSDPNSVADPNAAEAKEGTSDEMDKALDDVDKESRKEIDEWIRDSENKVGLARTVQEQVIVELNFIREIAVEEKAVKTTEAIDRILASRKERFEKIIQKLEDERKKARESEREERKDRTREREPRRTRERPARRSTRTE